MTRIHLANLDEGGLREGLRRGVSLLLIELVGKLHLKSDVHVAELFELIVLRKTLTLDRHLIERTRDSRASDDDIVTVVVLEDFGETVERLHERDLVRHVKIALTHALDAVFRVLHGVNDEQ